MSFLDIAEDVGRGTVSLIVRVQPRASKDEVAGAIAGALKIRLRAPAAENRANAASNIEPISMASMRLLNS